MVAVVWEQKPLGVGCRLPREPSLGKAPSTCVRVGREGTGKGAGGTWAKQVPSWAKLGKGTPGSHGTPPPPISAGVISYPGDSLSNFCVMSWLFSISTHTPLSQMMSYCTQGTVFLSLCTFSNPLLI